MEGNELKRFLNHVYFAILGPCFTFHCIKEANQKRKKKFFCAHFYSMHFLFNVLSDLHGLASFRQPAHHGAHGI